MDKPVLGNKDIFPTQEIINSHLGKSEALWGSLFSFIHKEHPDFTEEWRYYNDGKSWLFKTQRKKKTVFWLSLCEKSFRTTFYFTDKAAGMIKNSSISDELKEQFTESKTYGKIKGITIHYKKKKDVEDAKELIRMKLSIK